MMSRGLFSTLLMLLCGCPSNGARHSVSGLNVTWEDSRYRIAWVQSDARYARFVRLDRYGHIANLDASSLIEHRTLPGLHRVSLPSTDVRVVLLLLSRDPLGEDTSVYAQRCPSVLETWAAGPIVVTARDGDAGVPGDRGAADASTPTRHYLLISAAERALRMELTGGRSVRARSDDSCLVIRVTFP